MVFHFVGVDHLDRLVHPRIEFLPHGRNRLYTDLLQRVLKLAIDQFQSTPQVIASRGGLQSTFKTIKRRQNRFDRIRGREVPEFLLLACRALAGIVELGLQACQAVEKGVPLRADLIEFSGNCAPSGGLCCRGRLLIFVRRRKFMLQVEILCFSVSLNHN